MILGDAVSKLQTEVCMDFEPYFKVHNLVSVHPKSIILGQVTNLNMWWCQLIDLFKFETCPSSLLNFKTANCVVFLGKTLLITLTVPLSTQVCKWVLVN